MINIINRHPCYKQCLCRSSNISWLQGGFCFQSAGTGESPVLRLYFSLFFFLASMLPLLPRPSFNRYGEDVSGGSEDRITPEAKWMEKQGCRWTDSEEDVEETIPAAESDEERSDDFSA